MFQDYDSPGIDLAPTWRKARQPKNASIQTSDRRTHGDDSSQTDPLNHVTTQTDPERLSVEARIDSIDWSKLNTFLKSVEPNIVKTLAKNRQQLRIFDAYLADYDSQSRDFQAQLIRTVKHSDIPVEDAHVLSLTWNSTGNTLAAVFGHDQHDDWCTHRGWLCMWNVQRRITDPDKSDWSTDFASCCTCCLYHPTDQSLLAVGTYAGQLFVYGVDNELIGRAVCGDQQSVTCLAWSANDNRLFSGGLGGRIFVWKLSSRGSQDLQLLQRFRISVANLPRLLRSSDVGRGTGVTSLLLVKSDPDRFLATTETGAVFYCDTKTRNIVEDSMVDIQNFSTENRSGNDSAAVIVAYDPVVLTLQPHVGSVLCASASPFFDRIYATSGSDGTLCIRNALKVAPIFQADLNLGPIYACAWSLARPAVITCSTANHPLVIIDLSQLSEYGSSTLSPIFVNVGDDGTGSPANQKASRASNASFSLALNGSRDRSDWLALGNQRGSIGVWRMGEWFTSATTSSSLDESKIIEHLEALNFRLGD